MPRGLARYYGGDDLHFITFSSYHRLPFLDTAGGRSVFLEMLEEVRQKYLFRVVGYVIMPEHVHLLLGESQIGTLSVALQVVKQRTARKAHDVIRGPMWQRRFYDFNVFSQKKVTEKLFYMHENPVKRGLVLTAEDWVWSSAQFYSSGEQGMVKILEEKIPACQELSQS